MDISFGELICHKDFHDTFKAIQEANVNSFDHDSRDINLNHDILTSGEHKIEYATKDIHSADLSSGEKFVHDNIKRICGYDESFFQYDAVEGSLLLTSHSFVILDDDDWVPVNLLTSYFVTGAKPIADKNDLLEHSDDPSTLLKKKYADDRKVFLTSCAQEKTILFIDGPLISANMSTFTIDMVEALEDIGITPIFFVKNSNSKLVTDSIKELKGKYNSDIHWASNQLKNDQFSNWFKYTDQHNSRFSKVFCYYKPYVGFSPQRIEMHPITYAKNEDRIDELLNSISYLMIANGDKSNPQIRPIAIAEKFARETKKHVNIRKKLKSAGLVPTMNQERGFN